MDTLHNKIDFALVIAECEVASIGGRSRKFGSGGLRLWTRGRWRRIGGGVFSEKVEDGKQDMINRASCDHTFVKDELRKNFGDTNSNVEQDNSLVGKSVFGERVDMDSNFGHLMPYEDLQ